MPKIKAVKPAGQLDMSDAERMARMREAGMERGFWRGGKSPADGPYYTPDKSAAEAFGARHGPGADVREYALKLGKSFDFSGGVKTSEMGPIVAALESRGMGRLAKEIADLPDDWGGEMPAPMLYQVLDSQTGGDALEVLAGAGYETVNAGQEVITLQKGLVRDAEGAAFDPANTGRDDIYGYADPDMPGFTLRNAYRASRSAERNETGGNPLLGLLGGVEAAATIGSSMAAEPASGLAGLLALIDSPEAAAAVTQGVQDRLTYTPRTGAGRSSVNALAELLQPISRPMNALAELLASGGAEAARSVPFIGENQKFQNAAAALGYSLPAGLAELLPGGAATRPARQLSKN